MDGWTDGRRDGWMHWWMGPQGHVLNAYRYLRLSESDMLRFRAIVCPNWCTIWLMGGLRYGWMDGWGPKAMLMDGRMDRSIDAWMTDGRTDGWMEGLGDGAPRQCSQCLPLLEPVCGGTVSLTHYAYPSRYFEAAAAADPRSHNVFYICFVLESWQAKKAMWTPSCATFDPQEMVQFCKIWKIPFLISVLMNLPKVTWVACLTLDTCRFVQGVSKGMLNVPVCLIGGGGQN